MSQSDVSTSAPAERALIWDLPIRLFHWLLSGGLFAAAAIAFLVKHRSEVYPYHMLLGLSLVFMVVLRIVWGFVGTRYARFGSFVFGPREFWAYARGTLRWRMPRYVGHNPGAMPVIFAFFLVLLAIGVTGYLIATGVKIRNLKQIHEWLGYAMLGLVAAHVLGIVLYLAQRRENIVAGMITGRKRAEATAAIRSGRPGAALVFLGLTSAFTAWIWLAYDPSTRSTTLPLLATPLKCGRTEAERNKQRSGESRPQSGVESGAGSGAGSGSGSSGGKPVEAPATGATAIP